MKRNKFLEKNDLASLLEYKLEYKEEIRRIEKEEKRRIQNIVLNYNTMFI
ncbi:hypothetical protein [Oceanirhabdus seepicola]|uniref:Uncharacterized protein n=1 Tax=Oceanirhabdus seepicola TaxID=2828781 RepID=A0A9J6P1P0_9CLOT|nr:hypothetical protein [Oceanirhabdus seepicola]MCM1990451.1 hypothetical protein [Oceanirhabdus seepicola]